MGTPLVIVGVGTYTVDVAGNITFAPEANFNGNADVIYTVNDNDGATSNIATVGIDVVEVNNPPVANDNSYTIFSSDTIDETVFNLASDPDGDNLFFNVTVQPENGTFTFNSDGAFTYVPEFAYEGTVTFTYEVCDDGDPALCDTGIITISIATGDSDGDGTLDNEEDENGDGDPTNDDCDADGTADYLDSDECINLLTQIVITPNGDQINNFMKISYIDNFPDNHVVVFNRWGNKVWEIFGYSNLNSSKQFTGDTNERGNGSLPDGTYYYVIDLGNGGTPKKGFVVIKR